MLSRTSNIPNLLVDPIRTNTASPKASTRSFSQQLLTALEGYRGKSGNTSSLKLEIQPLMGRNSASGQHLVTVTAPPAHATGDSAAPSTSPAPAPVTLMPGNPGLADAMQSFIRDWSVLTPQQASFQLANAAGIGGSADPKALVPGTTIAFGDLNQVQQFAYQYALNNGTGSLSMQDFLTQNAGPNWAWNQSYNQMQQDPDVQAAVDTSYQAGPNGVPMPILVSSGAASSGPASHPSSSGNADNLPNPAMIQYLPADQQAAAEAALAMEGSYGGNAVAAAKAYVAT